MDDVLEFLKFNCTYEERKKEIQNYLSKKGSYKTLNLVVASTSLNFSKNTFNRTGSRRRKF